MVRYCSVSGCLEKTNSNKKRRFFHFPSDGIRCKNWIKAIDRIDLASKSPYTLNTSYYVCDLHFADSDCPQNKHLRKDAVPTLFLPQLEDRSGPSKYTQTDEISPATPSTSHSVQTQATQVLSESTPRKKKLRLELRSNSKNIKLLESGSEHDTNTKESDMHPLLKKIIDAQKTFKRNFQGNRYDQEYIMFALNVYYSGPVAYRFLSEILCLPNIRTLQRRISFGMSTNFDDNVIKCLQSKCNKLSEAEKYCIICADEVSLKRHLHYQINKDKVVGFHEIDEKQSTEIATQAFVVMARGIFSNWKQPLAFCFLSQSKNYAELNTWLENIIAKMIEIGFNVCAFTSDQGSNFINMAKNKFVSPEQPFFFINGKKIYYIFDVPHLIKSLRNNLINYDFVFEDDDGSKQVACWDDVQNMYNIEKGNTYRMAFKLTESHIKPNNFEKMRVKYATQVMSRTVAVAICTLIQSGRLQEQCIGTTKLIELINDTFDILNSSRVKDDYKYKKAFYEAEYQTNTLKKAQRILSGLRIINRKNDKDVTSTMKFIKGFLISIKAILSLASDLKTVGYNYLFTRRLNQDELENFLGKVRQQGGNCREPTAIQFLTAFRKLFLVNIIRQSEYTNCAEDLDQLLMSVDEAQKSFRAEKIVMSATDDSTPTPHSSNRALLVGTSDYRFELPEENAFTYVCGYLLNKCFDHHKDCEVMKNFTKSNEQVDENNIFTYFKANSIDHPFGALTNPPENFKQYIKQIDSICKDHFLNGNFYHVGSEIMTKISETVFDSPCPCFPLEYLKKLFVRFRIFNIMRQNNKKFKDKSFRRKYFSVAHL